MKRTFGTNSRQIPRQKILGAISARDAEVLLLDWANLPAWGYPTVGAGKRLRDDSVKRMLTHHSEIFAFLSDEKEVELLLTEVRNWLKRAWDAPDVRHRDWYLFITRYQYQLRIIGDHRLIPDVPDVTPFEAALFHLTRIADRMRHCPNPDCSAPYFFRALGKKVQKFCSPECGDPSRRESKSRWWAENRGAGRKTT